MTCQVLTETGLDPSGLRAKGLNDFLGRVRMQYAIIVCEQAEKHCPRLYPLALQTLSWPFADPTQAQGSTEERLRQFRAIRDQIAHRVRAWCLALEEQA
jgi:arsenate reductase